MGLRGRQGYRRIDVGSVAHDRSTSASHTGRRVTLTRHRRSSPLAPVPCPAPALPWPLAPPNATTAVSGPPSPPQSPRPLPPLRHPPPQRQPESQPRLP